MRNERQRAVILLDIDGVLVTTPAWRPVEQLADGFMRFNEAAAKNLNSLLELTEAEAVLTTTHRISYSLDEWYGIFVARGIKPTSVAKVNEASALHAVTKRADEVEAWIAQNRDVNYVIIDDDSSINGLPDFIKNRFVQTKPMLGLNDEAAREALFILRPGVLK